MSADVILLTEAQILTDDIRRDSIVWLARQCAEVPYGAVEIMLARWAHKSLDARMRAAWFAEYRACTEGAEALRGEENAARDPQAVMTGFFDDDDFGNWPGDPYQRGAELLENRAGEALFVLIHGEQER